jgi:hypothetical protein
MWSRDNEDLPDPSQHKHGDRVIDHRLVIDGHELLAHTHGQRMKSGSDSSSEDNAFAIHRNIRG